VSGPAPSPGPASGSAKKPEVSAAKAERLAELKALVDESLDP
jgi:hypothetical protein